MPAAPARVIVDAILDAVEQGGYSAAFLNTRLSDHPRRFVITLAENHSLSVWVYVWTLTQGGRTTLPHEYRIQMTTVASPLAMNPEGATVLLGYEPDLRLFAGFDLIRHRTFTTGSPSVQIDIRTVRQALQTGLSFDRKTNEEIAIGIRPDQLVNYAAHAAHLHRLGRAAGTFKLLARAAALETISDTDLTPLTAERQRIVSTVSRLARNGIFGSRLFRPTGTVAPLPVLNCDWWTLPTSFRWVLPAAWMK